MSTVGRGLSACLLVWALALMSVSQPTLAQGAARTEAFQPHHGAQCVQNQGAYILQVDWYGHDAFWYDLKGYLHVRTQEAGTLDYKGKTPIAPVQTDDIHAGEIRCWQGKDPAFAVLKVKDAQVVKEVSITLSAAVADAGIAIAAGVTCVGSEGVLCPAALAAAGVGVIAVDALIATTVALVPPDPKNLVGFENLPGFENTFMIYAPSSFGIEYVQYKHLNEPSANDPNNDRLVAIAKEHPGKMIWTYGSALYPAVAEAKDFVDLPLADWNQFKAWDRGCKGGVHTFHVRCENVDDPADWRTYCQPFEVGQHFLPERYTGAYFQGDNRKKITAVARLTDRAWMEVKVSCVPNFDWRVTDNGGGLIAHRQNRCEKNKRVFHARCEDENGNYSATACASRNKVTFSDGSSTTGKVLNDKAWIEFVSPTEGC